MTTNLTMHTPGRIGTAALLFAATAAGRPAFPQKLHARPTGVLASVNRPAHGSHALAAAMHASATHTKSLVLAHPALAHGKSLALAHPALSHGKSLALAHPALSLTKQQAIDRALAARLTQTRARAAIAPAARSLHPQARAAATPGRPGAAHDLLSLDQSPVQSTIAADTRPPLPVHAALPGYVPAEAFSLTDTVDAEHALHITVGHLMFLNTRERVRRIYIANPAVLDSYTVSPNQIVITAKAPGLSSVVVWDQTDHSQVYMVSSDINVDELRSSMKQAMPTDNVQVEGRESRIVLTGTVGTDASSEAAFKLAGLFSKDVANSLVVNSSKIRQVRLKVRIVEVDRSKLEQFGINIFGPGGASVIGSGTTGQFPSTATYTPPGTTTSTSGVTTVTSAATVAVSDALSFFLYSFNHNIGVTIKDLENKQILQILAEPTLTTVSGQKASFLAGGEFPFPVVQGSAGGTATVTVQFRPYGVKLEFTPVVNIDGSVALKVMPEVSALDYTNSVTISGYTIPALSTKRADTQVVLRSGQSFAISGLLDRRTTDIFSKTPGIASVPVLGQLFKSKNVNLSTSELIVIVTPTVVDPLSEPAGPDEAGHAEPAPAVPFMKPDNFDKSLPAAAKKQQ